MRTVKLRRSRSIFALLALSTAALAGCSDSKAVNPLDKIKVSGQVGKAPEVKISQSPVVFTNIDHKLLTEGTGKAVTTGQRVVLSYQLYNGKNGKLTTDTYPTKPTSFIAGPEGSFRGLTMTLVGKKIGSRLLVGTPPTMGFAGGIGEPGLGFSRDDSLIFIADIVSAVDQLTGPSGTPVPAKPGIPKVTDNPNKEPSVSLTGVTAPKTTVVQPVIMGKGPVVLRGQQVKANYVGMLLAGGKIFDSSFQSKRPLTMQFGTGQLIKGFDNGIIGQKVGSRVVLVIPPAEGYGSNGNGQAGIKATDTLVFVVDILDAY